MTAQELQYHLTYLGLTPSEAAQLLCVAPRTVHRWLSGEDIPGPAEQAFRAWRRLHERNLAWRPDTACINQNDQAQIAKYREHAQQVDAILTKVEAKGGPRLPWTVDREKCCAFLGAMQVSFYPLANGGFSLANYTRTDGQHPDVSRDWQFIEDAIFYIARELKKSAEIAVTLVYADAPLWVGPSGRIATIQQEEHPSNEKAIERACTLMQKGNFYYPFIRAGKSGEIIWQEPELRQECERRLTKSPRLTDHARAKSSA